MSAITSEWLLIVAEEAAVRPASGERSYSREVEFRIALDQYMAGYIDHQQRRAGFWGDDSASQWRRPRATRRVLRMSALIHPNDH